MLAGLYPGRIDLGIGRAAGTSPKVAFALQRDKRQPLPDDFRQQLDELIGYLPDDPVISLLGSSPESVDWAAELGLPYVFADFINANGAQFIQPYRNDLKTLSIACWVICADTDEEALSAFIQRPHADDAALPRPLHSGADGGTRRGVPARGGVADGYAARGAAYYYGIALPCEAGH